MKRSYCGDVAEPCIYEVAPDRRLLVDWDDSEPDLALVQRDVLYMLVNEINQHRAARPSSAEGTPQ